MRSPTKLSIGCVTKKRNIKLNYLLKKYKFMSAKRRHNPNQRRGLLPKEPPKRAKEPRGKVRSSYSLFLGEAHPSCCSETPPVRSPSASSDSGNSTDEEKAIRDDYAHPTSLKAWKQKKDKEVQELEQAQLAKAKRPPSATKEKKPKSPKGAPATAAGAAKPTTPRDKSPKRSRSPKRPGSGAPSEKSAVRSHRILFDLERLWFIFKGAKPVTDSNEPSARVISSLESFHTDRCLLSCIVHWLWSRQSIVECTMPYISFTTARWMRGSYTQR